jgi:hypothetical protein
MSDPTQGPTCPPCAELPSSSSAYRLVNGDASAILYVARDFAVRGAMGATGAYLGSLLLRKKLSLTEALVYGGMMSAFIEAFVLGYEATLPPPPPTP